MSIFSTSKMQKCDLFIHFCMIAPDRSLTCKEEKVE